MQRSSSCRRVSQHAHDTAGDSIDLVTVEEQQHASRQDWLAVLRPGVVITLSFVVAWAVLHQLIGLLTIVVPSTWTWPYQALVVLSFSGAVLIVGAVVAARWRRSSSEPLLSVTCSSIRGESSASPPPSSPHS
jgi:hypothetical protein